MGSKARIARITGGDSRSVPLRPARGSIRCIEQRRKVCPGVRGRGFLLHNRATCEWQEYRPRPRKGYDRRQDHIQDDGRQARFGGEATAPPRIHCIPGRQRLAVVDQHCRGRGWRAGDADRQSQLKRWPSKYPASSARAVVPCILGGPAVVRAAASGTPSSRRLSLPVQGQPRRGQVVRLTLSIWTAAPSYRLAVRLESPNWIGSWEEG